MQAATPEFGASTLEKKFSELLRQASLRPTIARLEVLSVLLDGAQAPIATQEVFGRLNKMGSSMKIMTCYRILAEFEKSGLVGSERLQSGKIGYWLKKLGLQKPTHRITCRKCNRGFVVNAAMSNQLDQLMLEHGLNRSGDPITILVECDCVESVRKRKRSFASQQV